MAGEHKHDDGPRLGVDADAAREDVNSGVDQSGTMSDISALLRTPGDRDALLRVLIHTMTPDRINPAIWQRWLTGGPGPFKGKKLEQPDPGGQSIGRALDRQQPRVSEAKTGVHNARRALDAARRKMDEAEEKLAQARALDAGLIQYAVSGHLAEITEPMFAMGPAWTVMRAISAHYPAEQLEEDLSFVGPSRRAQVMQRLVRERREGTDRILNELDYWSGDVDFEYELRMAIQKTVDLYVRRERPDRPDRTRAAMRTTLADPELKRYREEIIEGMKQTGDQCPVQQS